MNTKKIKYAKNFLPFIGLSLLIYIIYKVGINKIATSIAGINPLYLLFSFLIFIPRIFMSTYKWQVISKKQGINVDLIPMIKINLIGLFYGTITPLWIGDAIRIFYLKEKSNESLGKCVSNYTIDQIITLLSLFILAMIGSIIVMNSFPYLILTIFLIFIALLSTIIILKNEKRGKKLFNIIYNFFLPDKFKDSIEKYSDEFYKSMKMITERLDKFEKIKSGIYKVVFTPAMFLHISEAFLQGINGDNIVKKVSPLNGKIGQKVLDEKLTIEDRGADENLTGSVPFDDEGVPVSNKLIFEKGVLKNYIFDLKTASEYGTKSTGNGKRSYKEIARPGVHNFYIHPGNESIWKMVEKIDKGIWIESVVGGWTSNLLAGEYSATLLLAFYIENGEIKGRIKNAAITCNLYDVFNKVVGISKENQEIMNGVYPYIVVDGVNIALK